MTDLILTDDFDLKIEGGDFVFGDATEQNQDLLLLIDKGQLRQFPYVGVGVVNYLNDDNIQQMHGEVVKQYELDGLSIISLEVTSQGVIKRKAVYG